MGMWFDSIRFGAIIITARMQPKVEEVRVAQVADVAAAVQVLDELVQNDKYMDVRHLPQVAMAMWHVCPSSAVVIEFEHKTTKPWTQRDLTAVAIFDKSRARCWSLVDDQVMAAIVEWPASGGLELSSAHIKRIIAVGGTVHDVLPACMDAIYHVWESTPYMVCVATGNRGLEVSVYINKEPRTGHWRWTWEWGAKPVVGRGEEEEYLRP